MGQTKEKKIIICSNYAWTIYNFRMPLIKRLKLEGYEVIILTQFDGYEKLIKLNVDRIEPLFISRKGINPFIDIFTVLDLIRYFIKFKPDILLLFSIKPVIYGSIAAHLTKVKSIVTITGLGTVFISNNWLTKIVKILYKLALKNCSIIFFQNKDDRNLFVNQSIARLKLCHLIPGSGIDLKIFSYKRPPKSSNTVFLLVARMLADKGVEEFVNAARKIKSNYPKTRFQLLGPLGVENRTAISIAKMNEWQLEGCIEYLGETDDVASYIEKSCCVVLPSYREGTSRVLLEAAAIGRPLIATNVPGCKEVIENGVNGFLCMPRDYVSLSMCIEQMIKLSYDKRKYMGIMGRRKVENEFDKDIVCNLYIQAIKNCAQN